MTTLLGGSPLAPTTAAEHALNEVSWRTGGKAFVYVQADGAITADGYVVSITNAGQAKLVDTDVAATILEGNRVGVPDAAFADNEYGWVQVYGPCGVRSEQDALASKKLGPTADAGQLDDAAATGIFVNGIHFETATGGADAVNATAFLNWPTFEVQMEPETA